MKLKEITYTEKLNSRCSFLKFYIFNLKLLLNYTHVLLLFFLKPSNKFLLQIRMKFKYGNWPKRLCMYCLISVHFCNLPHTGSMYYILLTQASFLSWTQSSNFYLWAFEHSIFSPWKLFPLDLPLPLILIT